MQQINEQEEPAQVLQDQAPEEPQELASAAAPQVQQESVADRNFRVMREEKRKAERERDELQRYVQSLQSQQKPQQDEDDSGLEPDDYVPAKYVAKLNKEIRETKKIQRDFKRQQDEMRLRTKYPDIDRVMTEENITQLRELDPEEAAGIATIQDTYTQASMAYKAIKANGIYQDPAQIAQQQKAQANYNKPRPLNSLASTQGGSSPLSNANAFANGLTPELKKQLLEQMDSAIRKL